MIRSILVGLDGSRSAERCLPWSKSLAPGVRLTLLRAYVPVFAGSDPWMTDAAFTSETNDLAVKAIAKYLDRVASGLKPRPGLIIRPGSGASALLDAARQRRYDLIAVSTRGGQSLKRRLIGGTTEQLLHHAGIPLLVVPASPVKGRAAGKIRRIVVFLDGSRSAESILPVAEGLARIHRAEILLIHALRDLGRIRWESGIWAGGLPESAASDRFERSLQRLEVSIRERFDVLVQGVKKRGGRARAMIVQGECPEALLRAVARNRGDLIAMGVHGHGALQHLLQGSLASRILQKARVPVLLVRNDRMRKRLRP